MKNISLLTLAFLFTVPSFAQLPSHVPSNGLQGWWTFTGNTNDSSGNGNNGIAYGVSLTSDRKGEANSAYEFDITSTGWGTAKDRIEITQNSKVMDSLYKSQAFSISCWVKLKPKTGRFAGRPHTIFGVWDGGNKTSFIRFQVAKQGSNNNTYCTFNQNNPKFGNTKISDSVWSQIVITYDKDSSKLNYYLNSILDTSITMTYSIPSSTNYGNLTFGEVYMANGHWYHFNGSLDDIGIWNRALTLSEVSNLFNECTETYISDTITACDSYTWTNGITYTKSNTTAKDTFVNTAGCDSIVTLNLTINYSDASTDAITACGSYTWTNGVTYIQSNAKAKDTFVNTTGCDSIVTLNLTINNSDFISQQPANQSLLISQDATFDIGTSGTPSLTFQWQTDIGTGYQKMSNAGQYSGTQTKNLSISNVTSANNNQKFRCIVNDQYCSDTSVAALLSLYGVSVDNLRNNQIFHIYPNPASNELNIKIESNLLGSQFRIINVLGQEIKQGELSSLISTIDVSKLPKGSYIMLIGTGNYSHPFLVE